jgi:hypothetical protein
MRLHSMQPRAHARQRICRASSLIIAAKIAAKISSETSAIGKDIDSVMMRRSSRSPGRKKSRRFRLCKSIRAGSALSSRAMMMMIWDRSTARAVLAWE